MAIEICRKSPSEVRQGPIPDKHKHGRAQSKGACSTISDRVDQGQGGHHRRRTTTENDQVEKSKGRPMTEE
jgi:hypothetical protein